MNGDVKSVLHAKENIKGVQSDCQPGDDTTESMKSASGGDCWAAAGEVVGSLQKAYDDCQVERAHRFLAPQVGSEFGVGNVLLIFRCLCLVSAMTSLRLLVEAMLTVTPNTSR